MNMLRYILCLASVGLCLGADAQTYNARFDLFGEGRAQTGLGVEMLPDGSALVFLGGDYILDGLYYSSAFSSVVVSPEGEFSEGYRLHVPERANYPGWVNCGSPTSDGRFFVGGSTYQAGDTSRVALYWIESDGVVSDYVELDLPAQEWIGRNGKQTPDGGYIVVGDMANVNTNDLDAFAVKTDALGNVEWFRLYGGALWESFSSVEPAPWGGYYLGGQQQITSNVWKTWIVRVDADGEVLGEANYALYEYGSGGAQLTLLPDGSVLVGSAEYHTTSVYQVRACIFQVDPNGEVLWHREYGRLTRAAFFSVLPVPGSTDLVAVGVDDRMGQGGQLQGTLLRVSADKDSLWQYTYRYFDAQVGFRNSVFNDMQPTPDGGFIAVGMTAPVPGVYSQDLWVVKTDSMGCIEPGCHLITGVESQVTNLKDVLHLAPNPVAQGSALQVSLSLPAGYTVHGGLRLSIVSCDGRLVYEERLNADAPVSLTLPQRIGPGLYHLHLSDDTQWLGGAKVVVE